jgi:hypothetical protein
MDSSDEDYQDASHPSSNSVPPSTLNSHKATYRGGPQHAPVAIPDYSDEEEEVRVAIMVA